MKKLMTLALGMMFVFGVTATFAQEKTEKTEKKMGKKGGKKGTKKDDTTKTEKK
jgi:hypothetical protein